MWRKTSSWRPSSTRDLLTSTCLQRRTLWQLTSSGQCKKVSISFYFFSTSLRFLLTLPARLSVLNTQADPLANATRFAEEVRCVTCRPCNCTMSNVKSVSVLIAENRENKNTEHRNCQKQKRQQELPLLHKRRSSGGAKCTRVAHVSSSSSSPPPPFLPASSLPPSPFPLPLPDLKIQVLVVARCSLDRALGDCTRMRPPRLFGLGCLWRLCWDHSPQLFIGPIPLVED